MQLSVCCAEIRLAFLTASGCISMVSWRRWDRKAERLLPAGSAGVFVHHIVLHIMRNCYVLHWVDTLRCTRAPRLTDGTDGMIMCFCG